MDKGKKILNEYQILRKKRDRVEKILHKEFFNENYLGRNVDHPFLLISAFIRGIFTSTYIFAAVKLLSYPFIQQEEDFAALFNFFNLPNYFISSLILIFLFFVFDYRKMKKISISVSNDANKELNDMKFKLKQDYNDYDINFNIEEYNDKINDDINKIKDEFKANDFALLKTLDSTDEEDVLSIKELRVLLKYKSDNDSFSKTQKKLKLINEKKVAKEEETKKLKELLKSYSQKELTDDDIREINKITDKLSNKTTIENT